MQFIGEAGEALGKPFWAKGLSLKPFPKPFIRIHIVAV